MGPWVGGQGSRERRGPAPGRQTEVPHPAPQQLLDGHLRPQPVEVGGLRQDPGTYQQVGELPGLELELRPLRLGLGPGDDAHAR
eukprot:scaffold130829_cov25-Prasinocladus_malaysianus.AAC.1